MYMQRHSSQGPASFSHIGPRALELVRLQQSIPSFGDRKFSSATAADPQWRLNLKDHMDRVAAMSTLIAVTLGVGRREAALIGEAGRVHDLGKVFVNPLVLEKPGPLSDAEMRTVQMHTVWGDALLRKSDDPCLALAAKVALQHHENWDGSGYPYGLSGQQIGFAARIVSICDVYDSLREARPYKLALTHNGQWPSSRKGMSGLVQACLTLRFSPTSFAIRNFAARSSMVLLRKVGILRDDKRC